MRIDVNTNTQFILVIVLLIMTVCMCVCVYIFNSWQLRSSKELIAMGGMMMNLVR